MATIVVLRRQRINTVESADTTSAHIWCYSYTVTCFYKFLLVIIRKQDLDKACDIVWKAMLIIMSVL